MIVESVTFQIRWDREGGAPPTFLTKTVYTVNNNMKKVQEKKNIALFANMEYVHRESIWFAIMKYLVSKNTENFTLTLHPLFTQGQILCEVLGLHRFSLGLPVQVEG